jgi:hypothetical protein
MKLLAVYIAYRRARVCLCIDGKEVVTGHHLGGHLKTGQLGSLQNRPVSRTQDNLSFTLPVAVGARCFG